MSQEIQRGAPNHAEQDLPAAVTAETKTATPGH